MIEIKLTQNKVTIIDDDDLSIVSCYKWCLESRGKHLKFWYARANFRLPDGRNTSIYMHRLLMNPRPGLVVDHIDGDSLNNTRANLRVCTRSENAKNRFKRPGTSSRYKGVTWNKMERKWKVQITNEYRAIPLGTFDDEGDAARSYNAAAIKLYGEFASINEII